MYRRFAAVALAGALSACGQTPQTPATNAPPQGLAAAPTPVAAAWFICDGIDVPNIFVAKIGRAHV